MKIKPMKFSAAMLASFTNVMDSHLQGLTGQAL